MILIMGFGHRNRRRSSPFLFGPFSFVRSVDGVDNSIHPSCIFPAGRRGKMGGEAEPITTEGILKPVPKIAPASIPPYLPLKAVDYLGLKLEFRKSELASISTMRSS